MRNLLEFVDLQYERYWCSYLNSWVGGESLGKGNDSELFNRDK